MDFKNSIKWNRNNKNRAEQVADKIHEEYKRKLEDKQKNAEQSAALKVIELVQKNPQIAKEILKEIIKKEEIPNEVFEKAATEISKSDEIPDKVVSEVVKDNDLEIPDQIIANIIENGDMNQPETIVLIKNLEDEKIKKEKIKEKLEELYNKCEEYTELELVEAIKDLNVIEKDEKIKILEEKIIAKKMAMNYKNYGGTKIDTLSQCVPIEEMLEINLPKMVETEYKNMPDEDKKNVLDSTELKKQILEGIARKVVRTYKEVGSFIIPQSKNMENISKVEEKNFIKEMQIHLKNKLDEKQINDIKNQIRGKSNNIQLKKYIEGIKKLPREEGNTFIKSTNLLLEDEKLYEVYIELMNSDIMSILKLKTSEERKKYIETINTVLSRENKKEKVSKEDVENQR